MKTRISASQASLQSGAGVLLLMMAAASAAGPSARHTQVAVHPHACVTGQRTYSDLDAVVAAVRASGAPPVAVTACGSASVPAWLATVQRLSDFPLEPGALDASAPACAIPAGPVRVSQGEGGALAGIDPVAVERYWRQVQP
jgi:hypothetical protein